MDCENPTCMDDYTSNPDITGIGVAIANISTVLCLRILITWSFEGVDVGARASLMQVYPILLSSLASINQQQLTSADVEFALRLCLSPLMIYLWFTSFCDLFGVKTGLYKRITSHPRIVRASMILALLLWLALHMTVHISGGTFLGGDRIQEGFRSWIAGLGEDILVSTFFVTGLLSPRILYPMFGSFFGLCLFRRRSQVMEDVRDHLKGRSGLWRGFCAPWMFVKCAWCTVDNHHKWWVYLLFMYFDISWTLITAYAADPVVSYGQVLAILTSIPTFIETAKLIHARSKDLFCFLRQFPSLFLAEVLYLLAGIKPHPPDRDHRPPSTQPASISPEFHHTIQGGGTDGRDEARFCTSDVELREVSVAFAQVPLSQFESPSEQLEDATPSRLGLPGLTEPDRNYMPPNQAEPPIPTIVDVPLTVVRDIILASKTAIESLELICAAHELNPLITESVMRTAMENLPPVCENKDGNSSPAVDTMHAPPLTGTHGGNLHASKDLDLEQER